MEARIQKGSMEREKIRRVFGNKKQDREVKVRRTNQASGSENKSKEGVAKGKRKMEFLQNKRQNKE